MNITTQSSAVNLVPNNTMLANTLLVSSLFAENSLANSRFNKLPSSKNLSSKNLAPQENHLLAAISHDEWNKLEPEMEEVDLSVNQVLSESGKTPAYMYFPTTAIVSLLYMTESGSSSEVAVIGNDGVVGISLVLSGSNSPNQAVVQSAGRGYRIRAQEVKNAIHREASTLNILLRYSQAMITQVTQTAVCNRHHTIDQQLCRRLLLSLDLLSTNEISMTQEMLASMLGVRRESVTDAALKLQSAGIISYKRGLITILDRKALESRSCECYATNRNEQLRLEKLPLVS